WQDKFRELPPDVKLAWGLYHSDVGETLDESACVRLCTPVEADFAFIDVSSVKRGLADPEYKKFQHYSAAIEQALDQAEAELAVTLNPPPGFRPVLKGWSISEIDEDDGSVWPVPGVIPHGLTFVFGAPKSGKSLWVQKLSACIAGGVPFDGIDGLQQ